MTEIDLRTAFQAAFERTLDGGMGSDHCTAAAMAVVHELLGWRPIDTFPPGEFVLVLDGSDGSIWEARNFGEGNGWWGPDGADFAYGSGDSEFTHWMPKPPLPEPASDLT